MNETILISLALSSLFCGLAFMARYIYLDYKSKKEKSFILISLGLLAFWFFGGSTFLIIALILFVLFLIKLFF